MTLGNTVAYYRKKRGMTQEALANHLEVTNQAVSKWELDQCCPDIQLLPKLADLFEISLDTLFGREVPQQKKTVEKLPWKDDGALRAVLYVGHTLIGQHSVNTGGLLMRGIGKQSVQEQIVFTYEGPALNVYSAFAVHCGNVAGSVDAGTDVTCGNVAGDVDAGTSVNCGDVGGDVDAGTDVTCGRVEGNVDAGLGVTLRK